MRAVIEVAKLVEHLVEDLIEGEEIHLAVRPPKTELHLEAFSSFVHSMNGGIIRAKFGEKIDTPIVLAHNGLDQFGDLLKNLPCFLCPHLVLQGCDLPQGSLKISLFMANLIRVSKSFWF